MDTSLLEGTRVRVSVNCFGGGAWAAFPGVGVVGGRIESIEHWVSTHSVGFFRTLGHFGGR